MILIYCVTSIGYGPISRRKESDDKSIAQESQEFQESQELSAAPPGSPQARGVKRPATSPIFTRSLAKKSNTRSLTDLSVYLPTRISKTNKSQGKTVFVKKKVISAAYNRIRKSSLPDGFVFQLSNLTLSTPSLAFTEPSPVVRMTEKVYIKVKVPDLEEGNYDLWKNRMLWQLQLFKLDPMVAKAHDDAKQPQIM